MATTAEELRRGWILWAQEAFDDHQEQYEKYEDYYLGEHELEFSTERWKEIFGTIFEEFADNWCGVVVDAVDERIRIVGWDSADKGVGKSADECWKDTELMLPREALDLHKQALVKGDGYLTPWPKAGTTNEPEVFYNDALEVEVLYDSSNRRKIARAVKKWTDLDGMHHLRVYTPDHIEYYRAPSEFPGADAFARSMLILSITRSGIQQLGWEVEEPDLPNPYGVVPVIHFKNKPFGTHGVSELKSVIPIQNAVNKTLMDMMIASEFGGFPQMWMSGSGHPADGWKAGANRIWATTDPNAKFGNFATADLRNFVFEVQELVAHIAKITQTPMHYLRTSGDMPSGEALKTAESGLVHKCEKKAEYWKWDWAYAMNFILTIKNDGVKPPALAFPVFDNFETRHDLEQAQTAQLKALLGVPLAQVLREHFGYTDEQIKSFIDANQMVASQVLQQVLAQTGQLPPGLEDVGSLSIPQLLAALPKATTAGTSLGETVTNPQPNTRPAPSPTRRSRGFKD
jgi:hypothetical protein